MKLRLPYRFSPRDYQRGFLGAISRGVKRLIIVWPRRHGKDKTCWNALISEAVKRVGNYYYIFPEYNQGRKALWDNIDNDGLRTIHHIPTELIKSINNQEMKVELRNGSIIQVIGASDIDRIVGTNPVGIVFSEYSLMDPMVWGFLLPILRSNDGFAWFNFTPRGDNHAKELFIKNKEREGWFVQRLTAQDCGVFSETDLSDIRQEYFDLYGNYELYEQEFETSFTAPLQGAYYGAAMRQAQDDGRITSVPYDASVPVYTSWDLGYDDANAIWFFQNAGKEVHVIDYYENSGESLGHYVNILREKPYTYGTAFLPHDANAHELQTGKTRAQALRDLGIGEQKVLERGDRMDGIEAVRTFLSRCWFDESKCEKGIRALKNYHKEFDNKRKTFRNTPEHDWSSNGADSFRYLVQGWSLSQPRKPVGRSGRRNIGFAI